MSDDYYPISVETVASSGPLGAARDEDAESTLGDRFFDLLASQANMATKRKTEGCSTMTDEPQPVSDTGELVMEQGSTVANRPTPAVDGLQADAPFELYRLAMFRPPSLVHSSGDRRSNTVTAPKEENPTVHSTSTVELNNDENLRPNRHFGREQGRSFNANQIRQPPLSLEQKQQQAHRSLSNEQKTRVVLAARQQSSVRVPASSGAPAVRKPLMNQTNICTCGKLRRGRSIDIIDVRTPARVRCASADPAMSPRRGRTTGIGVQTNIAQRQRMVNPGTSHGRGRNGTSEAGAARQPLHKGPETGDRARMREVGEQRQGPPDIVSSSHSIRNTPPLRETPFRLPNGVGTGHISRPQTRTIRGPIRVQNTQRNVNESGVLRSFGTEYRSCHSVTQRPEAGAEASNAAARKPEVPHEFVPFLRSNALQNKTTAGAAASSRATTTQGHPSGGGYVPQVRSRLTAAERDAFFRRLSTPKTIANVKKGAK